MSERLRPIAAWLAVSLGLCAVVFHDVLRDENALPVDESRPSLDSRRPVGDAPRVGNDLTRVLLPRQVEQERRLREEGGIGRWDPWGFGGRPSLGNPQSFELYPPAWGLSLLGGPNALTRLTVAHLIWASLGAFLFARSLGLGTTASAFASGCFQASPYINAQVFEGHYPHVWTVCWFPWVMLAALGVTRGGRFSVAALPILLACSFLSGHPQEWYYIVAVTAAWSATDAVSTAVRSGARDGLKRLLTWSAIHAVHVGLIAFRLLPILEAIPWTLRPGGNEPREAGRYHIEALNFLQLFSPSALGGPSDYFGPSNYWETLVSFGLIPLAFAIVGVRSWKTDRTARYCAIGLALALVYAGGARFGLFTLIHRLLPGAAHFRVPARVLFLASLAASILAAKGVQACLANMNPPGLRRGRVAGRVATVSILLLLATAGALAPTSNASPGPISPHAPLPRLLAEAARGIYLDPIFPPALLTAVAVLSGLGHRSKRRELILAILAALGLAELGLQDSRLMVTTPAGAFLGRDPAADDLARVSSNHDGPFRVRAEDRLLEDLAAATRGIDKTNINDGFQLRHAADLYETLYTIFRASRIRFDREMDSAVAEYRRAVARGVLDRLGVAYLVGERDFPGDVVAEGRREGDSHRITRNASALPRAYVVPRAVGDRLGDPVASVLSRIDPRAAVLMEFDPLGIDDGPRQPFTPATYRSSGPDLVEIDVEAEAPGLLVSSDVYMPGWTAEVNGRETPIFLGDGAHRVVPLQGAKSYHIRLKYEPPGWRLGLLVSQVTLAAWISIVLLASKRVSTGSGRALD